jgi:hypothetical protein
MSDESAAGDEGPEDGSGKANAVADESPHDRMEAYVELAAEERASSRRKDAVLDAVGDDLAAAVAAAAEDAGVTVEVTGTSRDGTQQTLRARLDRAALVAAAAERLPDGFVVQHVNDDGTLTVQWDERASVPDSRHHAALLKAIVAEETAFDEDGLIAGVPTRAAVLARAVELGVPEDAAETGLARLERLDMVDIDDGRVYPDSNFSKR